MKVNDHNPTPPKPKLKTLDLDAYFRVSTSKAGDVSKTTARGRLAVMDVEEVTGLIPGEGVKSVVEAMDLPGIFEGRESDADSIID